MFISTYDPDKSIMVHTADEAVTVKGILQANAVWFHHPNFNPTAPVLWELNDQELALSLEEMRTVYSMVRDALKDKKRQGGKTAWVHPSALVRSMIDVIWQEFAWGSEWKTFATLDEAIEWCLD